jgi:hypothetical protein
MNNRLENVAAIVVDIGATQGSTLEQVVTMMDAIELLRRLGLVVVLVPSGSSVRLRKPRRWWRRDHGTRRDKHERSPS